MAEDWIAVDLDRTLAHYDDDVPDGEIGPPVPEMLERVKAWLDDGIAVKIFTARANDEGQEEKIQDWLEENGLPRLEVTATKDHGCIEIWDDIAVAVEPNTGEPLVESEYDYA